MKILLDAGHGGHDSGAVNRVHGISEEDITLTVALKTGRLLRDRGFHALHTRDNDVYISPSDRLKMIRDYKPDAFVSIHCNASAVAQAHGAETIYRDKYDLPLAQNIHKYLIASSKLRDRGIKTDIGDLGRRLAVLGDLKTPACLVEIGFISNEDDLHVMNNTVLFANAIADGIEHYASSQSAYGIED
jgi:N-acetylmuramoyl-L-alanine amidase